MLIRLGNIKNEYVCHFVFRMGCFTAHFFDMKINYVWHPFNVFICIPSINIFLICIPHIHIFPLSSSSHLIYGKFVRQLAHICMLSACQQQQQQQITSQYDQINEKFYSRVRAPDKRIFQNVNLFQFETVKCVFPSESNRRACVSQI